MSKKRKSKASPSRRKSKAVVKRSSVRAKRTPKIDGKGRVLNGRKFDQAATARYYKGQFKAPKGSKQAQRKALTQFAEFYSGQLKSGRVPVETFKFVKRKGKRVKVANMDVLKLAKAYGLDTPKGSEVTFLPRKFAGKRISFRGGIPTITAKSTVTYVHFIDFLTPEFLESVEKSDDPESQLSQLREEASKFINRIPHKKGEVLTVAMATGDYLAGSSISRNLLKDRMASLMLSFIKSKGADQLNEFVTAINQIVPKA